MNCLFRHHRWGCGLRVSCYALRAEIQINPRSLPAIANRSDEAGGRIPQSQLMRKAGHGARRIQIFPYYGIWSARRPTLLADGNVLRFGFLPAGF